LVKPQQNKHHTISSMIVRYWWWADKPFRPFIIWKPPPQQQLEFPVRSVQLKHSHFHRNSVSKWHLQWNQNGDLLRPMHSSNHRAHIGSNHRELTKTPQTDSWINHSCWHRDPKRNQ
jgi:hypothetical protein